MRLKPTGTTYELAVTLMPYFKRSGYCTRCEAPFDADATAFMVRETVIVAVCKKCLTDDSGPAT
jgi:hypothetical protein